MTSPATTRTSLYVDASVTMDGRAGGGFVARRGDAILVGAYPLAPCTGSNAAEAASLAEAVRRCLAAFPGTDGIDAHVDNAAVAAPSGKALEAVGPWLDAARQACAEAGADLRRFHCRGHMTPHSAPGFLNGSAHILASLGAAGEDLSARRPYDPFWRMRVMECHPRLVRTDQGLTRSESADYLGIAPETVDELVRHGHLRATPNSPTYLPGVLIDLREKLVALGVSIPARSVPLAALRTRQDDPKAGFGASAAPSRPVTVSVATRRLMARLDVAIVTEGRDEDEAFALSITMRDGLHWDALLARVVDLVCERHPGCDGLVLQASSKDLLRILTTPGRPSDLPAVRALDGIQRDDGFAFVAADVPPAWRDRDFMPWQARLSASLLAGLANGRPPGGWKVRSWLDDGRRLPPLEPLATLPAAVSGMAVEDDPEGPGAGAFAP